MQFGSSTTNVTWESKNWTSSQLVISNGLFDALKNPTKRKFLISTIPREKEAVFKIFFTPYGKLKKSNFVRFIEERQALKDFWPVFFEKAIIPHIQNKEFTPEILNEWFSKLSPDLKVMFAEKIQYELILLDEEEVKEWFNLLFSSYDDLIHMIKELNSNETFKQIWIDSKLLQKLINNNFNEWYLHWSQEELADGIANLFLLGNEDTIELLLDKIIAEATTKNIHLFETNNNSPLLFNVLCQKIGNYSIYYYIVKNLYKYTNEEIFFFLKLYPEVFANQCVDLKQHKQILVILFDKNNQEKPIAAITQFLIALNRKLTQKADKEDLLVELKSNLNIIVSALLKNELTLDEYIEYLQLLRRFDKIDPTIFQEIINSIKKVLSANSLYVEQGKSNSILSWLLVDCFTQLPSTPNETFIQNNQVFTMQATGTCGY